VCEKYGNNSVGILVEPIYDDNGDLSLLHIGGSQNALAMLCELINAVAHGSKDDSFTISASGAGRFHFSKKSKIGLAISVNNTPDC
jgi:hypothetical protein